MKITFKEKAKQFCIDAHDSIGQRRKYTHEPYSNHPINVAYLVECVGGTQEMICAAYLHDVLEDVMPINPAYNAMAILEEFNVNIYHMVLDLTDTSTPMDGNRESRKAAERDRLSDCSDEVQTIKLADLIDNSLTIVKYDPLFAKIYLKEKRELLNVMKGGNIMLWNIANYILSKRGY